MPALAPQFFRRKRPVVLAIEPNGAARRLVKAVQQGLYLVGNPVIANEIIDIEPREFLRSVPVCLYDNADDLGVMAYDCPSSFLAALERPELRPFGELLDHKIDTVASLVGKPGV